MEIMKRERERERLGTLFAQCVFPSDVIFQALFSAQYRWQQCLHSTKSEHNDTTEEEHGKLSDGPNKWYKPYKVI